MKKLVIFDLDGTLLDSVPDIMDSINRMLASFGYPAVDRTRILSAIGEGGEKFVRHCLPEGHKEEVPVCRPVYNALYKASGSPLTVLFDGLETELPRLKAAGVKLAILTNKPHENACSICDIKLKDFGFDLIFGNREGKKTKPDPAVAEEMLRYFGVDKKDAVVVGDGEQDMQVAKNAGIDAIAVLWGYRDEKTLKECGADYTVDSPKEMVDLILSL